MSEPAGGRPAGLRLTSAASLVVASMVGAGVFTTSGFALADLGRPSFVLAAWAVGGVIAACGALSYGALARAIPRSGGEYTFLARTVHPLAGFVAGWVSLVAGFTFPIAVAGLALAEYVLPGSQGQGHTLSARALASGAIVLAALLHALRPRQGVLAQDVAVALKLLLVAAFLALGGWRLLAGGGDGGPRAAAPATAPPFDLGAFAVTLVWVSFSYSGWNAAVYVAGELRDPRRDLPRALLLATAVVTVAYLGLNAVFVHAAPVAQLAGRPDIGAAAAHALGGPALAAALRALVALALLTSVSSMVMAGPRVYAAMADDGLFPRLFAASGRPPAAAITLQAALALAAVWLSDLRALLGTAGFTLGLCAAATVAGLLRLRRRSGAHAVPVPGHPLVPLLFVAVTTGSAAFLAWREPAEAAAGLGLAAAALPLYAWWRRR